MIQIASNATLTMRKWGHILANIVKIAAQPDTLKIMDQAGKALLDQPLPPDYEGHPNCFSHRGMTQQWMYNYALSLGIEFQFSSRISEFFEDESSAGIIIDGQRHSADFVIGADGVHSKARNFVTGKPEKPQKSGFAVYRSWFPLENLVGNPRTEWIATSPKDLMMIWIGKDTHAIITTNVKLKSLTCFATHKDTSDIEESWSFPGNKEDMEAAVKDWDPVLIDVIRAIPPEVLIDWKLLWRNPVKQWISSKGRTALVGDAAHPHLATSGTGGAQAIEDGATLGSLIDINGKNNIPLALRAYEKLRYCIPMLLCYFASYHNCS